MSQVNADHYGYAIVELSIKMGVERNYKQTLDELHGPRLTSDLIHVARRLFETAGDDHDSGLVVPSPTHFSDTSEATRVYWRLGEQDQDHEFFQVHLIGRSLSFALQHRHAQDPNAFPTSGHSFVDHQKTVLVVGSQRPTVSSYDGVSNRGTRNALSGWETDLPKPQRFRHHRERDILLPAFRQRLDHTMAAIGIHESIPGMIEMEELMQRAS